MTFKISAQQCIAVEKRAERQIKICLVQQKKMVMPASCGHQFFWMLYLNSMEKLAKADIIHVITFLKLPYLIYYVISMIIVNPVLIKLCYTFIRY